MGHGDGSGLTQYESCWNEYSTGMGHGDVIRFNLHNVMWNGTWGWDGTLGWDYIQSV